MRITAPPFSIDDDAPDAPHGHGLFRRDPASDHAASQTEEHRGRRGESGATGGRGRVRPGRSRERLARRHRLASLGISIALSLFGRNPARPPNFMNGETEWTR
jgi:hypothetical protein